MFRPTVAQAAEGLVTCQEGGACSFCHLMEMVNGIVEWLIVIVVLFTILMMAYAGFLLIFSAGNRASLEQGKQLFFNGIIGMLIMLAGWTMVDTVIKLLVGGNLGMWNEVQCGAGQYGVGGAAYDIDLEQLEFEAAVEPGEVITLSTGGHFATDGEVLALSPCDESSIITMGFLGHSIRIHRNLQSSLENIDAQWRARGGNSAYRVYSVGGYDCRKIAGSDKNSYHSYGVAIDVNPPTNPHLKTECRTDMPQWFRDLFIQQGWGWGCNWSSSKDAMHFSKASGEGGNGRY